MCVFLQPRKLLETSKCEAEDTQALAVSNCSQSELQTPSASTQTSTLAAVKTCDVAPICLYHSYPLYMYKFSPIVLHFCRICCIRFFADVEQINQRFLNVLAGIYV